MDNVPTAEDFYSDILDKAGDSGIIDINKALIDFAKLHVRVALKNAKTKTSRKISLRDYEDEISKDEILDKTIINAYPLKNITNGKTLENSSAQKR